MHILASSGYAPGTIAVNVTWMERGFNACQTHCSMYPSIFNRFSVIKPVSLKVRYFSTFFLHILASPRYAPGTIAINVTRLHGRRFLFNIGRDHWSRRRRRENRGAVGAEGGEVWEGVSPSPLRRLLGSAPSPENFRFRIAKWWVLMHYVCFLQFRSICQHLGRNYWRGPSPPKKILGDHVPRPLLIDAYAQLERGFNAC